MADLGRLSGRRGRAVSLMLDRGKGENLSWNEERVDQIVRKIQSINFKEEPSANEP